MMSKVHFWIVCDAVEYVKKFGNAAQKRALQAFQIAYGERKSVDEIPRGRTAVEYLAGFESWQTDKFKDLSLDLRALPGGAKHDVTGLGWNHFTAFNHFINPYSEEESGWPNGNGYSYSTSSRTGCDSVVVQGISRCLHGVVDLDASPVFDRIRRFWKFGENAWKDNFERGLSATKFAPWSLLSQAYYSHLLLNHYEPLEVRGANQYIVGLQLLGPVLHAVADACSPQHVRSALGFGHSIWENYVKSRVYQSRIGMDGELVRAFLSEEPFALQVRVPDGTLKGMFDVEDFVRRLSVRTANKLMESSSKGWQDLWQTEGEFWRRYLTGATMKADAHQFYNLAVAGTVHALERSCADLFARGVLTWDQGLAEPRKLPDLDLVQKELPQFPMKQKGEKDPPPEEVMAVPYTQTSDILGFDPIGVSNLGDLLRKVLSTGGRTLGDRSHRQARSHLLKEIELAVMDQYLKMADRAGPEFCPLRIVESIPVVSDLSAHWGTATFRMPSSWECDEPELFRRYMELSDSHAYSAHTLQLTQAISALRYQATKFGSQSAMASRLTFIASEVERFRDEELGEFSDDFSVVSARSRAQESDSLVSVRGAAPQTLRSSVARAWEKVSSAFTLMPKMALATVAAAVLLLIIILPRGEPPEQILGLSSEQWKSDNLRLMGPSQPVPKQFLMKKAPEVEKTHLVVLIYFRNFPRPIDQKMVDEAYQAARPSAAIDQSFDVVRPDEMKAAVEKERINTRSVPETTQGLQSALKVQEALIVTISAHGPLIDIECRLTDAGTGKVIRAKTHSGVPEKDFMSVLRNSIREALAG